MMSTIRAGAKNSPVCRTAPAIPATRTATATSVASLAKRAGVNAAAAASGAGALARSSSAQLAVIGSAESSAEMVINWAAPAEDETPMSKRLVAALTVVA